MIHNRFFLLILLFSLGAGFCGCKGKQVMDSLLYGNESASDTTAFISVDSNRSPIIFDANSFEGQTGFESVVLNKVFVKLIPNRGARRDIVQNNGVPIITNVLGVTQFLMDYDLTSGYVHPFVINFFRILRPDDFVLKFHRDSAVANEGWIEYVHKADAQSEDSLAKSTGFFRQWRLSEIDYSKDEQGQLMVKLKESTYAHDLFCPQVKLPTHNPFGAKVPEIPIWVVSLKNGMQPLNHCDKLGLTNGGAVVIIWDDTLSHKILFKDVYGSLKRILTIAVEIADKYHTDPTIGIYDAARMAWKLKAKNGKIRFADLDELSVGYPDYVSAGFGYVIQKQYVKTHHKGGHIIKREYEMVKDRVFQDL